MTFRELLKGSFGIFLFQKCQVCGILPFGVFPIYFTLQGLNTHICVFRPCMVKYIGILYIYILRRIHTSQTYTHTIVMLQETSSSNISHQA